MSKKGSRSSTVSTISNGVQEMTIQKGGGGGGGGGGEEKKGLGMLLTAFFLVAQMAGAGFLSLPKAIANSGWLGVVMIVVFCLGVGLSGTRLGICWVILEERWPQVYGHGSRQPYMDIAERALGKYGRLITLASVVITLFGTTTVYLILTATFMNALINELSTCEWVLVTAAVLLPFTWLGTPKDFWQASVVAAIATSLACLVIFVEILVEADQHHNPMYDNPTFSSFALGFGAILFAFGGASVFPTIQNDMRDRSEFVKSVIFGFAAILTLYLPVAVSGYAVQGVEVNSNILLSVDTTKGIIKAAIVLEILNLLGTYLISFNPVAQTFEELLGIENKFNWKRVVLRSAIVLMEVVIGLAVPNFDKILNLIGGSTVTMCSFILPPLMYMRLVDMKIELGWTKRTLPLWQRTLLWEIIIIGVVGGLTSTVTAFIDILDPDSFDDSCFVSFSKSV